MFAAPDSPVAAAGQVLEGQALERHLLAHVLASQQLEVRLELASLGDLLRDASVEGGSSWRLVGLGGVRGDELRDVQFGEMPSGPAGRIERRVFADRARISVPSGGRVKIEFYEGAVQRGERTAPFLDGVYRLVLPYADVEAWRKAEIPRFDDGR